jgi:uncharacterized membrane protein
MQTLTAQPRIVPELSSKKRIHSIDFLRGLVMVIMALDHVRDYFHAEAMTDDPTNLLTTTPFLFFTRWITHFCAPVFVFLAGTSAFLLGEKKTKKELSIFLLTRGLWLILAEILIICFGWTFDPLYDTIILQVIWAIGVSMVILSAIVWLPFPLILLIGVLIVYGHNLLDSAEAARKGQVGTLWNILHRNAFVPVSPGRALLFFYAFPVWTGVMVLGYCFGKFFSRKTDVAYRRKALILLGSGSILLFIVLRLINHYGDPARWSEQKTGLLTFLSFLNVSKYPPSLMYCLMTLGPAILFLAFFERIENRFSNFFITFGRVPFFYYVLHIFLIHILCAIAFFLSGYGINDLKHEPFNFRPPGFGFQLWAVYLVWVSVVFILYPLCKWYNQYKMNHSHWALSYV